MELFAYAGKRAVDRHTTVGARRHAVTLNAHMAGLVHPDSECGEDGYVFLGPWNPADPLNCPDCARLTQVYVLTDAPVVEDSGQLALFGVAA